MFRQKLPIVLAGVLRATVAVVQQVLAGLPAGQSHPQGIQRQLDTHVVGHGPAHDLPAYAGPSTAARYSQPSRVGIYVMSVTHTPAMPVPGGKLPIQRIVCDRVIMGRFGRPGDKSGLRHAAKESFFPHDFGNGVAAGLEATVRGKVPA